MIQSAMSSALGLLVVLSISVPVHSQIVDSTHDFDDVYYSDVHHSDFYHSDSYAVDQSNVDHSNVDHSNVDHSNVDHSNNWGDFGSYYVPEFRSFQSDIMDTSNHTLLEYRRMFRTGTTPAPHELIGTWRGVNKGIVQLAGYNQFIKEFSPCGNIVIGDNIQVHQVSREMLRCFGWQPKTTAAGQLDRGDRFEVQPPRGIGAFRRGAVISYRAGGNGKSNPVNLIVDKIVKLDDNHLLGRATAKFGPLEIPLAFFVLERIQ